MSLRYEGIAMPTGAEEGTPADGMNTLVERVSIGCMNRLERLAGLLAARTNRSPSRP